MKTKPIWEKVTHSGRHHAILFIDTVFKGYQDWVIKNFFQINFNPTHYRQFNGARWWLKEEINAYILALKKKEKENPGFLFEKAKEYEALNEDFFRWSEKYTTTKWSEMQSIHLLEIFEEFVLHLSKINALVYTASMLDRFYTGEITQIVMNHEKDFEKQKEYSGSIFSIDWGIESHFEKESLLFIAKIIKENGVTKKTEQIVGKHITRFKHLYLLAFYRQMYNKEKVLFDINKIITSGIEKERNILIELNKNTEKVKRIMKILQLSEDEMLKIETLRKWTFIANNDDHYVMGAIDNLWGLWEEMARRLKVSLEQFVEMRIEEVVNCIKNETISEKLKCGLLERQKGSALIWDENGIQLLIGNSLFTYTRREKEVEEKFYHLKEIKGQSASSGKAVGSVKILTDIQEMNKVQQGDILVAIYTYPAIVVAMEKAAAIITDQGGLLSHAAIVSRELGKPCIVGTKIATKAFKDGDIVEVDANKGIVKKIK